jgi:hypothetical protein
MSRDHTNTSPLTTNVTDSQSLSGTGMKSASTVVGSVESMSLKNEFWDPLFYDQDFGTSERVFFFVCGFY